MFRWMGIALAALISFSMVSFTAQDAFADKCKNVTLKIKNGNKKKNAYVIKLKYKMQNDNTWRTVDLKKRTVDGGKTTSIKVDMKGAEGNAPASTMEIHYKLWCGGQWSKDVYTHSTPEWPAGAKKCQSNWTAPTLTIIGTNKC